MRGAGCWTDNQLLGTKLSFSIAGIHRRQKADIKKKLDVQKLANSDTKATLPTYLRDKIDSLPTEADAIKAWDSFRDAVFASANLTLGHKE